MIDSRYFNLELSLKVLFFLFPVLAVSVKSWASGMHVLIFLCSLLILRSKWHSIGDLSLSKVEKLMLGLFVLIFAWYLLTEALNGWNGVRSHWPWIDFRYVMAIPVYLALRFTPEVMRWFLVGAAIGCMIAAGQAVYQAMFLKIHASGAYSHLFLGPVCAAFAMLLIAEKPFRWDRKFGVFLAYAGASSGLIALLVSSARSGMLAVLVVLVAMPLVTRMVSWRAYFAGFIVLAGAGVLLYHFFAPFRMEIDETRLGFTRYFEQLELPRESFYEMDLDNVTSRFEMWRSALLIGLESPVIGTGRHGYAEQLDLMIRNGEGHPWMQGIQLPHSGYFYHFTMRGLPGLVLAVLLLVWPAYIFLQARDKNDVVAIQGIIWVIFFAVVSLTQSSVFSRGHFLSVFLTVLVLLLASIHSKYQTAPGCKSSG